METSLNVSVLYIIYLTVEIVMPSTYLTRLAETQVLTLVKRVTQDPTLNGFNPFQTIPSTLDRPWTFRHPYASYRFESNHLPLPPESDMRPLT